MSRDIKQAPDVPYYWPKGAQPPQGRFQYDPRICFGIIYFDVEADAERCDEAVRAAGCTYNGGFFHGHLCGREESRDYTDDAGVRWHAVTE